MWPPLLVIKVGSTCGGAQGCTIVPAITQFYWQNPAAVGPRLSVRFHPQHVNPTWDKQTIRVACTPHLYARFNSRLTRFGIQNMGDSKFLESPVF